MSNMNWKRAGGGWASNAVSPILAVLFLAALARPVCALQFPGPEPGAAGAKLEGDRLTMQNAVIAVTWDLSADRFGLVEVVDRLSDETIRARTAEAFTVELAEGRSLVASQFRRAGKPTLRARRMSR